MKYFGKHRLMGFDISNKDAMFAALRDISRECGKDREWRYNYAYPERYKEIYQLLNDYSPEIIRI